jgi:predicted lipoprotein with Yx(FWY)xxD motif
VSSNFVHGAPRRSRPLILAAAGVAVAASLALAGPLLAQSAEPGGEVYTVNAATTDLGTFLTGEDGKTLYFFAKDTAPGASTCDGDCITNWPLFTLEDDETLEAGDGVTGVLATFTRADGTKQVSYDGRPVYYFAGDAAAGDTNGQGKGDVWYVAAVDGTHNGAAPSPAEGGLVVNTSTTDLGTVLVDADGKTLYYFTTDTEPGTSVCDAGGCLENWPVFGPTGDQGFAPGEGVTGVLGSFTRGDGIVQATYDGRPLYYFVGDQAAGDTTGQGIGDVWFVAAVDGSVPAPAASEAPAMASPTALSDGY